MEYFTNGNTQSIADLIPNFFGGNGPPGSATKMGNVFFAVTDKNCSNERFVFVSNELGIFKLLLSPSGITYTNSYIPFSYGSFNQNEMRSGMEVSNLNNGNFRLAVAYDSEDAMSLGHPSGTILFTIELDQQGIVVPGSQLEIALNNDGGGDATQAYIHGLEFSPDGNILYVTHNTNSNNPHPIEYYDFTQGGTQLTPLLVPNAMDFDKSQMQIDVDGDLALVTSDRIAALSNPNFPNLSNWMNTKHIFPSSYSTNSEGYTGNSQSHIRGLTSYIFPEQIDGMDYTEYIPNDYHETSYTVQNSATWTSGTGNPWNENGAVLFENELIIPSGVDLTVDNMTLQFGPDAKVVIEQGAKLTIDGATFTNSNECRPCQGEYWKGIEVWGTSNQHQYNLHNPIHQGMLKVINGGTIEYAHDEARNWKPNDWDAVGGVIVCDNATFKNNRRDVEFVKYQNLQPGNPSNLLGNLSRFENTTFTSDDNFIEGNPILKVHVSMWAVNGIDFVDCHFSNTMTGNKTQSNAPSTGIHSLDAGYNVLPGCSTILPYGQPCPTNQQLRSSFTGLRTAITATSSASSETFTVSRADFTNNVNGIRVSATHNVSINRNDIALGDGGYSNSSFFGSGITIRNSSGYLVEESTINSALPLSADDYGIRIINSGKHDNRVYKNYLFDQSVATLATEVNRSPGWTRGLQFLCNEYTDNDTAIAVRLDPMLDGIRDRQGDLNPLKNAGNKFTSNNLDISNVGNTFVYHHSFQPIETPSTIQGLVFLDGSSDAPTNCPSTFITGKPFGDLVSSSANSDSLFLSKSALDSTLITLEYNLIALIDNGNTEALQQQVENNWSSDAWNLRNNLIQKSPFLSADAILTAAEQNILPNAMLLEVLLANPDATSGESFIADLNLATNNSLPAYMLDFVRNSWNTETTRTNLEAQIAATQAEIASTTHYAKYLEKIKKDYTYNSRKAAIETGDDIMDEMEMMEFFIGNHEWTKADSVLLYIENNPNFADHLAFVEDYDDYITFRAGLGTRTLAELDSTETAYLETLAAKDGRVADFAQNILCFFYDNCTTDHVKSGGMTNNITEDNAMAHPTLEELMYNVELYPNPANDFSSIKWEIFDVLENCTYQIFDLSGKKLSSGAIPDNKGELTLDTRRYNNGTYIINIYNGGALKSSSKLVVTKN